MWQLSCAWATMGGLHIGFEMGGTTGPRTVPQPHFLSRLIAYQPCAIMLTVVDAVMDLVHKYGFGGPQFKLSNGVVHAFETFVSNTQSRNPIPGIKEYARDYSPADIVKYIQEELDSGRTWENGLRRYLFLQYHGTVLMAVVTKLLAGPAGIEPAYQSEKWANDFIKLSERTFRVTADDQPEN